MTDDATRSVVPCPWCDATTVIHDGMGAEVTNPAHGLSLRLRPQCAECGAQGPVPLPGEHGLDVWNGGRDE